MTHDARGVPVSCASPTALDLYETALAQYQSYVGDPIATRDGAHRFGGSHAQRDVLTLTLIEAALRGGQPALARHYIAERTVHRPASGWGWRLLARASGPWRR